MRLNAHARRQKTHGNPTACNDRKDQDVTKSQGEARGSKQPRQVSGGSGSPNRLKQELDKEARREGGDIEDEPVTPVDRPPIEAESVCYR